MLRKMKNWQLLCSYKNIFYPNVFINEKIYINENIYHHQKRTPFLS